jgi:uncharacterized protein YjiS (DUF1127 family)
MFASLHTSTLTVRRVQSRGIFDGLFAKLRLAYQVHTQRQKLAVLDDAALADIGLSRAEALAEASRSLWDVPANWRC